MAEVYYVMTFQLYLLTLYLGFYFKIDENKTSFYKFVCHHKGYMFVTAIKTKQT